MKKLHILIPSLVATATMPLIGLVGCGKNKEPEPEPVYQDIEMIEQSGVVSSDTFDLEKNTYYRIYCTNISSERN
ncbi:MAG: hypothetical protein MJ201_05505 [Mycoplasmoidaceae bacterium]|nr:hypothetical protein [Mycoplasmoidaceae bacterium]